MGQFLAYSLQSAICLALFYLFFKVLLSRDTFHRFNRIALLGVLALSLIMPLIAIPLVSAFATNEVTVTISELSAEIISDEANAAIIDESAAEKGNIYLSWLLVVYLTGCAICFLYTAISIISILYIIKTGKRINKGKGPNIIISKAKNIHPFSWMKYIILSQDDYNEAGDTIIAHEKAHISLHHTYDLIIAQVCIITQWFNPAIWLLYQELQNIHEYEADDKVLSRGIDARQYQLLLIKKAVGTRLYSMANSFNHSNLKKRITMMLQKKSNSWARLKYSYVLPLAVITVTAIASPEISEQFEEISNAKISHFALETSTNDVKKLPVESETPEFPVLPVESSDAKYDSPALIELQANTEDSTYVFNSVEDMPAFPGGNAALLKYIADKIIYPENVKKEKIDGRVNCQFVVNTDGSVSDVIVLRSLHPELDKEAVRVLSALPKFKPGKDKGEVVRVRYSVPVRFGPKEAGTQPTQPAQQTKQASTTKPKVDPNDPTLYITVEDMPEFPGGNTALLKYFADNIIYPEVSKVNKVEGRVNCQFVVEKDGSVSNIIIVRGIDQNLDNEAVRVLSTLPKFKPGKEKGEVVRVKYSVPVRFSLGNK